MTEMEPPGTMTWVRRDARPRDTATSAGIALAAGIAVGAVTFYLARTLLAREPLRLTPRPPAEVEESG